MIREIERKTMPGFLAIIVLLALNAIFVYLFVSVVQNENGALIVVSLFFWCSRLVAWLGLFIVNPNEAKVLQLFGNYVGTVRTPGLRYANPLYTKKKISTRVRNFETDKLKVNDKDSNPIEIAAVVVWRVVDTAEALFEVDNFSGIRAGAERSGIAQPSHQLSI